MLAAIKNAQHSVLAQFYSVKDDDIGHQFKQALIGSGNWDNRWLRINFELSALIESEPFALQTY